MEFITAATIVLTSMNVMNKALDFVYNTECIEDVVTATVVYKKSDDGKYLSHHLRYSYTYDEQQRLVKKEALKWNACSEKWENSHCLSYVYDECGYSIEYARWSKNEADYANIVGKQTYVEKINGVVAIASYKWDKAEKNWRMQNNTLMMNPGEKLISSLELDMQDKETE